MSSVTFDEAQECLATAVEEFAPPPAIHPGRELETESLEIPTIEAKRKRPRRRRSVGVFGFFGDLGAELGLRQEIRRAVNAVRQTD